MLVLHWLGIGRGDEVIIPAYTYCATAFAVMHAGATPVMVDVKEDFNIDPEKVRAAITPKTKAIIPVDFAGWPCDYDTLFSLVDDEVIRAQFQAKGNIQQQLGRIAIIADAAHSFGAKFNSKKTGSLADITVFSFHAVKNLTTAEGGAICLTLPAGFSNAEIYKTLRLWTLNGQTKDAFSKTEVGGWKYDIVYPGFKINMPDVCAAIGLAQIRKYDGAMLKERKRVFEFFSNEFERDEWAELPPFKKENCLCSYHLYPLRIKGISEAQRDEIIDKISSEGVAVNVHFIPLPLLTVFKERGYKMADFPVSFHNYSREISLPIYPQLDNNLCKHIVTVVRNSVSKTGKDGCNKVG
jgi:dTDP-4-amino-4,6-dideoxygalactose transaminase